MNEEKEPGYATQVLMVDHEHHCIAIGNGIQPRQPYEFCLRAGNRDYRTVMTETEQEIIWNVLSRAFGNMEVADGNANGQA